MTFFRNLPDECFIHADNRVLLELSGEVPVGVICLCDDHDTGGILIQPVDEPGPLLAADIRYRPAGDLKVME